MMIDLLLALIVAMFVIMIDVKITNLAKDRALRAINKIIQIKLQALNLKNLTSLICQTLEKNLKGKFAIILTDQENTLIGGEARLGEFYDTKIKLTPHPHRLIILKSGKVLYYYPLSITSSSIGVLLVEVGIFSGYFFGFKKVLPLIANHISFILESFRTLILLNNIKLSEEREKVRSLLLSSISHDLKTPLCSIINGLTVFKALMKKNEMSKEDQEDLIAASLEEATRLNKFICNILEMTRIESGAIALKKELINPSFAIKEVLGRLKYGLERYQLKILLNEKIKIDFDLISFEQIIQNLIDNIIKYSPKNTQISIYDKLEKNSYEIFIQDEGGGIDPDKLELMFNKFERLNHQTKPVGHGLGLTIVKALMEINGASIFAMNIKDRKGMVFVLKFCVPNI